MRRGAPVGAPRIQEGGRENSARMLISLAVVYPPRPKDPEIFSLVGADESSAQDSTWWGRNLFCFDNP